MFFSNFFTFKIQEPSQLLV